MKNTGVEIVQTIDRISCGSGGSFSSSSDVSVWLLCPTRESDEGASFPKQGPTFNDVWQTLEINSNHPVVVDLLAKIIAGKSDKAEADTAQVLFQTALADVSALVNRGLRFSLHVEALAAPRLREAERGLTSLQLPVDCRILDLDGQRHEDWMSMVATWADEVASLHVTMALEAGWRTERWCTAARGALRRLVCWARTVTRRKPERIPTSSAASSASRHRTTTSSIGPRGMRARNSGDTAGTSSTTEFWCMFSCRLLVSGAIWCMKRDRCTATTLLYGDVH